MSESTNAITRPLTVSEWFVMIFILALPLVNIVMYLYWAFAEGVNVNKRNFCRASILWFVVGLVFGAILLAFLSGVGALQGQ